MPVASATQAPSRKSLPSPWSVCSAGCQHCSGMASTIRWIRVSTGNPKENPTPRSTHAAANAWVAPAESLRASSRGPSHVPGSSPGRGRACSGSAANAMSSTMMWSSAVLEPALPLRSSPASASPPATSGRSRKHSNGWNPKVFFQVAAAFSFSLCAIVMVASKSRHSSRSRSGPAPAAHAAARAAARACANRGQVVGIDAVQHPPRGRHRGHRPEQVLPVTQHADPADRVRAIGDRDRQIGEHPTRRMHREPLVGADQRGGDPVDQAGVLGHLPEQTDPGVRHHALPVRADHDPPYPLATLHLQSACPVGDSDLSQARVSHTGQALSRSRATCQPDPRETPGLAPDCSSTGASAPSSTNGVAG